MYFQAVLYLLAPKHPASQGMEQHLAIWLPTDRVDRWAGEGKGKEDPSERKQEFRLQWEQCHVTKGRRQMTGDLRGYWCSDIGR